MKCKPRVRNYIARNSSGSGKHKDKKKEYKNGIPKHKIELFIVE